MTYFLDLGWPGGSTVAQKLAFVRQQIADAFLPAAGSPLIDAGVLIPGYHCPTADDDPITPADPNDSRRHWFGSAFEFVPNIGTGKIISLLGFGLDFGDVPVNTTVNGTLRITNIGDTTLTVTSITYPSGFTGAFSGTIASGTSHDVTVTFAPIAEISYGGTITVNSDKTGGTNTITCSGNGVLQGNSDQGRVGAIGRIIASLGRI
jgi:hypothetical protein